MSETRQKSKITRAYRVKTSSMKRHNEGGAKFWQTAMICKWLQHQHWEELKHLRLSWVFLNGNGSRGHRKDLHLLAFSILTLRLKVHFHSHLHTLSHTYRSLSIPLLTLHEWGKNWVWYCGASNKRHLQISSNAWFAVHSYTVYKYLYSLTFSDSVCFRHSPFSENWWWWWWRT